MWTGGSGTTAGGLGERETSRTEGRRKQHCGGDEQGRSNAYKWAPPGAAVAGQPPSAHAREGSDGGLLRGDWAAPGWEKGGAVGPRQPAQDGGEGERGEERGGGKPRLGRVQRGVGWATRRGGGIFPFSFSYLALNSTQKYFSQNHSTTSKQNMVRHDATTIIIKPRVYLHKISS
jgi:hypothetical protein